MSYILVLCFFVVVCNAGCGTFFAPSGNFYNLDSLARTPDYVGREVHVYFNYYYNYCQYINRTALNISSTCTYNTYVAQLGPTGLCVSIGSSPPAISEKANKQGVDIVYVDTTNLCGNPKSIPRVSTLSVSCNRSVEYNLVSISEPAICSYNFSVQSRFGCPNGSGNNQSDCCSAQPTPGCLDHNIELCVCKTHPECCTKSWNITCVRLVESLGCGDCGLGSCCQPHRGVGCEDRQISRCVCERMQDCCTAAWTSDCVSAVNKYKCGQCQGVCCNETCTDTNVRNCVCSRDVYCCNVKWDATCVEEAKMLNCTTCPPSSYGKTFLPREPIN